jgi:hypothetical protein
MAFGFSHKAIRYMSYTVQRLGNMVSITIPGYKFGDLLFHSYRKAFEFMSYEGLRPFNDPSLGSNKCFDIYSELLELADSWEPLAPEWGDRAAEALEECASDLRRFVGNAS